MAQGIAEVGGAGGIRYWPMMARRSLKFVMSVVVGNSLKLAKSLAAGGSGEAAKAPEVYGCWWWRGGR